MRSVSSVGITLLALATPASADVVVADWTSPFEYHYRIVHMPDFDQKRGNGDGHSGLPGNGNTWCGPTATMNALAYIAQHGYPSVRPGVADWQSQSTYDDATQEIYELGTLMGTTGTDWSGMRLGLQDRLAGQPFTITVHTASSDGIPPTHNNMAASAIDGSLVCYSVGRYSVVEEIGGIPVIHQEGGHVITLVEAWADGQEAHFWVRNPADGDEDLTRQSTFGRLEHQFDYMQVRPDDNPGQVQWRSHQVRDDDVLKFITGYVAIKPRSGYSFSDTGIQTVSPFGGSGGSLTTYSPFWSDEPILDVALGPDQYAYYVLHGGGPSGPPEIYRFNPLDGTAEGGLLKAYGLETLGHPLRVGFSAARHLLVMHQVGIARSNLASGDVEILAVPPDWAPAAFDCDDVREDIWMLSVVGRRLLRVSQNLDDAFDDHLVPVEVPLAGAADVACSGLRYWAVCSQASNCVYVLRRDGAGTFVVDDEICDGDIVLPNGVAFDDDEHLFVTSEGSVAEFSRSTLGWRKHESTPFAPLHHGRRATITRSRSSYDPALSEPALHDDPDDFADDGEVPDCPADIDGDRQVGVSDLLAVLSRWGEDDPLADIAPAPIGDDVVGVADLLEVIARWGACD